MAKQQKIDLKSPDAFHTTSDKIFELIEEHAKTVIGVVVLGVVLSLAFITYSYVGHRREAAAAEALFGPEGALKKAEATASESREKESTALSPSKKPASKTPKSFAEQFEGPVSKLEQSIKEHGGTRVALVSALNLSYFLVREGKAERAVKVLESVSYRPSSSDILAGFYGMHRGLALLEAGQFAGAAESFAGVLSDKKLAALHAEAALKMGVARELGGDATAAREAYEKVGREFPGSEAATSAQNYLRALTLKARKG